MVDLEGATNQYWGGCLDSAGNVIFCPHNAVQVMKINPENDTITYYGLNDISTNAYYKVGEDLIPCSVQASGGAIAANGNIYFSCRLTNNNAVKLQFYAYTDSINETVGFIDISAFNFGGGDAEGIVTGMNDRYVYPVLYEMGPYGNNRVIKRIDTNTNQVETFAMPTGLSASYSSYSGGVLAPDGKIYWFSHASRPTILALDSIYPTYTIDTTYNNSSNTYAIPNPQASELKMYGGILGCDGKIYTCPYRCEKIQVIEPSAPIGLNGWMISPYYNKT